MDQSQFASQFAGQTPNNVMKFMAAMQAAAQQHQQHHGGGAACNHCHSDNQTGRSQAGGHGHSHGGGHGHSHGGLNQAALLKMMQEKMAAAAKGGDSSSQMEHLHTSLANKQFEQTLTAHLHKMEQERSQNNITSGYVLQDPNASKGPHDSWFHGGGHFTPPVFGWGSLAKGYIDPQKNIPPELDGSLISNTGLTSTKLNNAFVSNLPFYGRIRYVKDKAGWIQSFIVLLYWIYGNFTTWYFILLPHYSEGNLSLLPLLGYASISSLCITSFLRAVTSSPGVIPKEDSSSNSEPWTFCQACQKHRPPKAHHCRRCGQCVPMMDHHCPWINNCVGEENQWLFMQLVGYAYLLSFATLILDIMYFSYLPMCQSCDHTSFFMSYRRRFINVAVFMGILMMCGGLGLYCSQHFSILLASFTQVHAMAFMIVITVMAIMMAGAGASLYLTQHMYVKTDTSTLDWMKLQSEMQAQGKLFDASMLPKQTRSMREVYERVCGMGPWWMWPLPCRRRQPPPPPPKQPGYNV